jgi:osmotically-inducible protein OsmY
VRQRTAPARHERRPAETLDAGRAVAGAPAARGEFASTCSGIDLRRLPLALARATSRRARRDQRALPHRPGVRKQALSVLDPPTSKENIMKTDSQLQRDVTAELAWEPSVHATQIGVEVRDGVVTLAGNVATYAEKWNAERAAQRVAGVKALAVDLQVKLAASGVRSDGDIAQSARNVLDWTSSVESGSVKIMVEKGWITLTGKVDWNFQKQDAVDAVRFLMGVVGVSDHVVVTPGVNASVVKSDIEAAIKRGAIEDAKRITVGVNGTDVTLGGSVQSWAERDLATESAWKSPGVRKVIDNMTLAY